MSLIDGIFEIGTRMKQERASLKDVLRVKVSDVEMVEGVDSRIYNHCLNKSTIQKFFGISKVTFNKRLEEATEQGVVGEPIFQNKNHLYTRFDVQALMDHWGTVRYADNYHARVVAIENHKGGTGKSTTCVTIGVATALDLDENARVCIIDMDPQGTQGTNLIIQNEDEQVYLTMADLLLHELEDDGDVNQYLDAGYSFEDVVASAPFTTHLPNLDVIPAFPTDDRFTDMYWTQDKAGRLALLSALRDKVIPVLKARYDVILIDTPPQDSPILWAVNEATDCLLVPVTPHEYDFASTTNYMLTLASRFDDLPSRGSNIKWMKMLIVNHDDKSHSEKATVNKLVRAAQDKLFTSHLIHSEAFLEASSTGRTVMDLKKSQAKCSAKQFDEAMTSINAFHRQFINEIKSIAVKG